jgi:hypothetical protein
MFDDFKYNNVTYVDGNPKWLRFSSINGVKTGVHDEKNG